MNYKKWTKEELQNSNNWDFSFSQDWQQQDAHDVWLYETSREYGIVSTPFCETKRFDRYPTTPKENPTNPGGLASVPFSYVAKEDPFTGNVRSEDDHSIYYHLIEIDHTIGEEKIKETFEKWLKNIRKDLSIPKHKGGRPTLAADSHQLLEDLSVYRLHSAGFNSSQAKAQLEFTQSIRITSQNPTAGFNAAARQAKKRLDALNSYFQEVCSDQRWPRPKKR